MWYISSNPLISFHPLSWLPLQTLSRLLLLCTFPWGSKSMPPLPPHKGNNTPYFAVPSLLAPALVLILLRWLPSKPLQRGKINHPVKDYYYYTANINVLDENCFVVVHPDDPRWRQLNVDKCKSGQWKVNPSRQQEVNVIKEEISYITSQQILTDKHISACCEWDGSLVFNLAYLHLSRFYMSAITTGWWYWPNTGKVWLLCCHLCQAMKSVSDYIIFRTQMQQGGTNCWLFAIAYATVLLR